MSLQEITWENLNDAADRNNPEANEIVNAAKMNMIKSVVNGNKTDAESRLFDMLLSDGMELGTNHLRITLYYLDSADITVNIASGLASGCAFKIINLGTGSVTIGNVTLNKVPGQVLPGTTASKSEGRIVKLGTLWYGIGDFVTEDAAQAGFAEILSARSTNSQSNKVIVKMSAQCSNVLHKDFLVFGSHVKIDESVAITEQAVSGGYEYTFTLDDYFLPDDHSFAQIYYFGPSGSMRDAGNQNYVLSFTEDINIAGAGNADPVTAYNHPSRTLVQVSSGTTGDVSSAWGNNKLVAIQRGGTYSNCDFSLNTDNCYFTAYGSGNAPVFNGTADYVFEVTGRDNIRFANIKVTANEAHGIAYRGSSSFGLVNSCIFDAPSAQGNKAIILNSNATGQENMWGEGMWAINNTIDGFEDGINSKFWGSATWASRSIGANGEIYRVEANTIDCPAQGGAEGDCIALARGIYYSSKGRSIIRNNKMTAWGDDAIDMYGSNGLIVEYNVMSNRLTEVNSGGRGIKTGGTGGGNQPDARSGYNTVRFNIVHDITENIIGGGTSSSANGIDTNNGGDFVNNGIGTEIYGNIVYDCPQHAMQVTGTNGANLKMFNNMFIGGASGNGVNFYNASNLNQMLFANNILNTINGNPSGTGSNNNVITGARGGYTLKSNDIIGVTLAAIFDNTADLKNAKVKAGSPTINNGANVQTLNRDLRGTVIATRDIGPIEYVNFQ